MNIRGGKRGKGGKRRDDRGGRKNGKVG